MATSPLTGTRPISSLLGLMVIAIAISVLLGWLLDFSVIQLLYPNLVKMNPFTAIGFLLAGLTLIVNNSPALESSRSAISTVLIVGILIVGASRLLGLMGWDPELDRLLFTERLEQNRMAPNTAFTFLFLGAAFLALIFEPKDRGFISQTLSIVVGLISLLTIVGYLYGLKPFYGVTTFIPMAIHTGCTFLLSALGIMCTKRHCGMMALLLRDDLGGRMIRLLLPAVILIPLLLGWARLVGERNEIFDAHFGTSLLTVLTIVILTTLIFWFGRKMSAADQLIKAAKADLEVRIEERMSELRQTEGQVQQLQKMDAVGRLAGGVAHDFNNILGAINMYCDLIDEDTANPKLLVEHAGQIRKAAERGASLTRQLLIFSRKQIIQPKNVNLSRLIPDLVKMLERLIGENIEISTNLANNLQDTQVDPSQMEQVIMNLVVNARDAMPAGGKIKITTSNVLLDEDFTSKHLTVKPGPHVLLSVSDTGLGMDEETQNKIFEPFFTTKPVGKGTGLGLTTTYGIIKQCRGSIWVYSEPGQGTVFKIYLPAVKPVELASEAKDVTVGSLQGSETILLVEDEFDLRNLCAGALQRKGYKVLAAANGQEALKLLMENKSTIHLLLTDVVMPEMGGFDLAKKALAIKPGMRVLFMSGYANDEVAPENAGFDYIEKPFNTKALGLKVKSVLG